MLKIQIPESYEPERRYIFSVIFEDFFGIEYNVQINARSDVHISADDGRELIIADGLFAVPIERWLKASSLPTQPLKVWDLSSAPIPATTVDRRIPVIYGDSLGEPEIFDFSRDGIRLGIDIFGSAFFMLTRYEEVVKPDRDTHGRFPAKASLACQEGFLDRPIINEYVEILWACLKHLWPNIKRSQRQFQVYTSHDVDTPFSVATMNFFQLSKRCRWELFNQRSPLQATQFGLNWLKVKARGAEYDPCNTFDLIMDINEKHNLKSTFYFITDQSAGGIDGFPVMNHPLIRNLLRKIHLRGHEIGLHPSYNTFQDGHQTKKEFEILKSVCAAEGIEQNNWGSRQHYLRWETPTTFQNLEDSGFNYDTTLAFADISGFRCGVCYEFPAFNVVSRHELRLMEHPLIVMEGTILDKRYMDLGLKDDLAFQAILKFKRRCQIFNGNFTLLWHNNRFIDEREIALYKRVLA